MDDEKDRLKTRQLQARRTNPQAAAKKKDQLQPGYMLQGRYRIIGTLGRGGFSSVYQARDMRFPAVTKLCAIKEMINLAPDPELRELTTRSFEREASMLATLDHPGIPDVYDFFTEETRSYLVLQFIRGKDLEAALDDLKSFPEEKLVLDWAMQICDVLSYLHSQKPKPIVFRDLKPSNMMLDPNGRLRLIDFGIAKLFETGDKGTMVGTEGYSPPEQYRGKAIPAGDIYALGATMHHLLTRQDPRLEPPFSFAERPIRAANPAVSASFEALIMRCLSYDAGERYPDAQALKIGLESLAAGGNAGMIPPPPPGYPPQPPMGYAPPPPGYPPQQPPPGYPPQGYPQQGYPQQPPMGYPQQPPPPTAPYAPQPGQAAAHDRNINEIKPYWTFKCEDEIRSIPAVADGMVFVGAYDNNLYALTTEEGKFLWKFPATDGIGSSPCVYKGAVYIGSSDGNLYSIKNHNGKLNWRYATDGPIFSSPRAHFDHIFFGSDDGHLYALSADNGKLVWKVPAHGKVRSTPSVTDQFVFFGTQGGYVFCLDLQGQVKWQFEGKQAIVSQPAIAYDLVLVGSYDATLYALDYSSGWALWRMRTRRPIVASPIVHGEAVYVGSSDGVMYALDALSGRKLWKFETKGQIASTAAIWEDALYFGSTDGYVYSLDLKRGRLRWRFKTGGMVVSSPTIENGVIYIGSTDHHIYALPA